MDVWGDFKGPAEQKFLINKFHNKSPSFRIHVNALALLQAVLLFRYFVSNMQAHTQPQHQPDQTTDCCFHYQLELELLIICLALAGLLIDILVQVWLKLWSRNITLIQLYLALKLIINSVLFTELFILQQGGDFTSNSKQSSELVSQSCNSSSILFWQGLLFTAQLWTIMPKILLLKMRLAIGVALYTYECVRQNMFQHYLSDSFIFYFLILIAIDYHKTINKRIKIINKFSFSNQLSKKHFYKECLQVIPEGICILNKELDLLFANQYLQSMFPGYTSSTTLAQDLLNISILQSQNLQQQQPPPPLQQQQSKTTCNFNPQNEAYNYSQLPMSIPLPLKLLPKASSVVQNQYQLPYFQQLEQASKNCQNLKQILEFIVQLDKQKQSSSTDYKVKFDRQDTHQTKQQFLSIIQKTLKEVEILSSQKVVQQYQDDKLRNLQISIGQQNQPIQQQLEELLTLKTTLEQKTYLLKVYRVGIRLLMGPETTENYQEQLGQQEVFFMVMQDISKDVFIQALSQENEQSKSQLSQTSHEFRTPLNCSIAMLERLKSLIEPKYSRDFLEPALFSSKLLLNLVNDMLDYSQIGAGKFSYNFTRFKLRKTIAQAIQLISLQAQMKKIQVIQEIDKQIPIQMTSDPDRLRQIFLNLLSNALKFTKQGYVKIHVSIYRESPLTLYIQVIDTGIGIKKENQEKLFRCFGKVNDGENRKINAQGVGLGLIISNNLVRGLGPENNGGIIVNSEYGKGTTFSFLIVDKEDKDLLQLAVESDENILNSSLSDIYIFETNKKFNSPRSIDLKCTGGYLTSEIINFNLEGSVGGGGLGPGLNVGSGHGIGSGSILSNKKQIPDHIRGSLQHCSITELRQLTLEQEQQQQVIPRRFSFCSNASSHSIQQQNAHISSKQCILESMNSDIIITNLHTKIYKQCQCQRVLVVDDNLFNLLIFQRTFEKYLPNVDTANCGQEAIDKIKQKLSSDCCKYYRLIFMDIEMPDIDGFEVILEINKILHNFGFFSYIFIACSAYNEASVSQQMTDAGLKYYLQKPVEKKKLKLLLKKIYEEPL